MILAGVYGFADLVHDIQSGTMIDYEHGFAPAVKHNPNSAQLAKGWIADMRNSIRKRLDVKAAIAFYVPATRPEIHVADLTIRSFSRGDFSIVEYLEPDSPEGTTIATVAADSLKTPGKTESKEKQGTAFVLQTRTSPDSLKEKK